MPTTQDNIDELWRAFDRENSGTLHSSSADELVRAVKDAMERDGVPDSGAKSLVLAFIVHLYVRLFSNV
ncbi:hypothetical protein H310_13784 [Aphanomyces invadans]|uniref:EF-hand domain-containing protein n=1 Tax=Aphanomyces invadans TaxID=157072 RepID=A0A024TC30_9STRA|nr:hypothetical protein H310_13784 [Aphanomyces invadans]ETV91715.1 hypothetical protein H310_13784 [Aphanomyces invadans]|eukprot:XP_008879641.1 hypothetical protein H310_13784 [Aphanomyces invadans]